MVTIKKVEVLSEGCYFNNTSTKITTLLSDNHHQANAES